MCAILSFRMENILINFKINRDSLWEMSVRPSLHNLSQGKGIPLSSPTRASPQHPTPVSPPPLLAFANRAYSRVPGMTSD